MVNPELNDDKVHADDAAIENLEPVEDKGMLSKAITQAKHILTGTEEPIDKVLAAKSELEEALEESKETLIKDTVAISDKIKEIRELEDKADKLDGELDNYVSEVKVNPEKVEEVNVSQLREVVEEVKVIAKETQKELIQEDKSLSK